MSHDTWVVTTVLTVTLAAFGYPAMWIHWPDAASSAKKSDHRRMIAARATIFAPGISGAIFAIMVGVHFMYLLVRSVWRTAFPPKTPPAPVFPEEGPYRTRND